MSTMRLLDEKTRMTRRTPNGAVLNEPFADATPKDVLERLAEYEDTTANPERTAWLMELQTPKLPRVDWYRKGHYWLYYCGNCGSLVEQVAYKSVNAGSYCAHCGQRVDWNGIFCNERKYFKGKVE